MDATITIDDVKLVVEFTISAYTPAKLFGPPELCHPAEGGEIEIESVSVKGVDILSMLSDAAIEAIEAECYAYAEREAEAAEADYYDMLREEREYA